MPEGTKPQQTSHQPEHKIGPFSGGVGVAVWLNTIETEAGPKKVRSITISPRRYRDPESGEWRDGAFRPIDLPALILALQKAQEHCYTTPIPGQEVDADGEVPF